MKPSRRQFVATAATVVGTAGLHPPLARAIDPIKRPSDKPDLKLSLAAYSYRQFLDLKKPTMTLFEFIDFAAELPLDAVELTSYYFAETIRRLPGQAQGTLPKKKLRDLRCAGRQQLLLCATLRRRKQQIQSVKDWTERAAKLGATTVRIFAGSLEKGDTLEEAQKRVVDGDERVLRGGREARRYLALENHGGITDTPEHLLELVKPVKSKALGVNIDTGNFHTADPYADIAKIAPYGVVSQVKTEVYPGGKQAGCGPRPRRQDPQGRELPRLRRARIRGRGRPEGRGAEIRQGTAEADWVTKPLAAPREAASRRPPYPSPSAPAPIPSPGHRHASARVGAVADQDRPVERVGRGQAVAAPHDARVQRHHVHRHAEAELLLKNPAGGVQLREPQPRVEEQFARVEPGLVVDGDRPGVIRGEPSSSQNG